jgi:succinate dehydrogenase/fumarate reductase flavoprotein subunit
MWFLFGLTAAFFRDTILSVQELCDEEWIQVHYKTLIHMENSGCPDFRLMRDGSPHGKWWFNHGKR